MVKLPRILVATDFSRVAERALARAGLIAEAGGVRLDVVHVAAPVRPALLRWLRSQPEAAAVLDAAKTQLERSVAGLRSRGVEPRLHLLTGSPVATLEAACRRLHSSLVVVGARGARGLRDQVLGTTAERLIERLPCDLLTVRKAPRQGYQKILACVDGSPASARALGRAAALWPDAHIHVLYAYEPPLESKLRGAGLDELVAENRASERKAAERTLNACLKRTGIAAGRMTPILDRGYPPQVIERRAARLVPDLITVGHSTSPLVASFLGSVARHVLRLDACDVLIAQPQEPAA